MKISIVTVCYNTVDTLEKTMLSVLNQTYADIEYIIIDGGSTDGTVDIIRRYAHRIAYWVSEPDGGIYEAMNKGIERATGEWINFMNAGDCFAENDILKQIFQLNQYASDDILYGNTIGKYKCGLKYEKPEKLEVIKKRIPFCHQSVFVKTQLVKSMPFDLSYKIGADYNMFYHFFKRGAIFRYINVYVSVFEHGTGISSICNIKIWYKENARSRGEDTTLIFRLKYFTILFIQEMKSLFTGNE